MGWARGYNADSACKDKHLTCGCTKLTIDQTLSMDTHFGLAVGLPELWQHWLRYFHANEAFTASGRWYLGTIPPEQLAALTAE